MVPPSRAFCKKTNHALLRFLPAVETTAMQTFIVEVLNDKAISLLRDLENLDIIRLTAQEHKPADQAEQDNTTQPLSEQFRGVISPELAADLHRQLDEMRDEWERDI